MVQFPVTPFIDRNVTFTTVDRPSGDYTTASSDGVHQTIGSGPVATGLERI
jgi:hypothetical protein